MSNQDLIHYTIQKCEAYQYSVDNYDVHNMRIVLKGWKFPHARQDAVDQINKALDIKEAQA